MSDNPTLYISECENFDEDVLAFLRKYFNVVLGDGSREQLLQGVEEADMLWVRLRYPIDAEVLERSNSLRVIVTATTGLNHIDLGLARLKNIEVLSLRGETEFLRNVRATAEFTIALMLAVMRRLNASIEHVKGGGWHRDLYKGNELAGKTVGIVGHGRLGRLVASYLEAFGCTVIASDPKPVEPPEVPLVELSELLAMADIVSLHVNLNAETTGFFGRKCFSGMQQGAWFVNTARGELVDEAALLDALESGQLGGAALDVLANENSGGMGGHPLVEYARTHDNLIVTPHIGGATFESMARTEMFMAEKLVKTGTVVHSA